MLVRLLDSRQSLHGQLAALEENNQQLQQQLTQAQRLSGLGMAWALTAHEINNLLTSLTNYARLALQHPHDEELSKKALEKSVFLGQRAGDTLTKIMEMASGKSVQMSRVELSALLDDVLLCIGRDFEKDGIELVCRCRPGLALRGDRILLAQVLMNLILNARRAVLNAGGGHIWINAGPSPSGIQIEVMDTGCGMSPEVIERIFDPFYGAAAADEQYEGNGLGLVCCKQIVDAHNGCIQVESEPHKGTTFRILLPND